MLSPDSLHAFTLAADLGSFSAAARRLGKAQSAVSTAIANLEIDTGLTLFDRSTRSPTLTREGKSLLPHAKGILLGNEEFMAKATSMVEEVEHSLCLAIEQGINMAPVLEMMAEFAVQFPHVSLELLSPGPNDTAALLKEGRADIGLMTEQESYPSGFQFRGVGHVVLAPVCGAAHPLAGGEAVTYRDLRQHRQLIPRSRSTAAMRYLSRPKSASVWYAESPGIIVDLLRQGIGWAELPLPAVRAMLQALTLTRLNFAFQQCDDLMGVDVVWTEQHVLGVAGQWLRQRLLNAPQEIWSGRA